MLNAPSLSVQTPIFSHETFAGPLAAQSVKVYFRLVHTPLIAEHLDACKVSGTSIEAFANYRLGTLESLDALLTTLAQCLRLEETLQQRPAGSIADDGEATAAVRTRRESSSGAEQPPAGASSESPPAPARGKALSGIRALFSSGDHTQRPDASARDGRRVAAPAHLPRAVIQAFRIAGAVQPVGAPAASSASLPAAASASFFPLNASAAVRVDDSPTASAARAAAPERSASPRGGVAMRHVSSAVFANSSASSSPSPSASATLLPPGAPATTSAAAAAQRHRRRRAERVSFDAHTTSPLHAHGPGVPCHADYADLAGWLHLLVWTRVEVIGLLRGLSGAQTTAAWSAWYWAWAQDHPRQATIHVALNSTQFWRHAIRGDCVTTVTAVHATASGHMMALRSVFRLVLSCVGAAHGLLESLNGVVSQVQMHSEMSTSQVASAAAVAMRRTGVRAPAPGSPLLPPRRPQTPQAASPRHKHDVPRMAASMGPPRRAGSTLDDNAAATAADSFLSPEGAPAPATAAADDDGAGDTTAALPDCYAYNAVEALRVVVLSTITQVSAIVGARGLASDITQSARSRTFEPAWVGRGLADERHGVAVDDYASGRGSGGAGHNPSARSGRSAATPSEGSDENTLLGEAQLLQEGIFREFTANMPGSPGLHLGEFQSARKATLAEGVLALGLCVRRTRFFLDSLTDLVRRAHHPPATRHWRRVTIALATVVPAFVWVYSKSPQELAQLAQTAVAWLRQVCLTYIVVPAQQLHEAMFYVRPGVEERRSAFDRNARALANIVRDYHADYYPNYSQLKLDRVRDECLDCMRRGVADERGYGLVEQHYRSAVKHPIAAAVFGDLPRILLIQLSYQELEMSRVTNGIDEVLEGNDLNFKAMALMPVVGAAALMALWAVMRWRATMRPVRHRMKLIWRAVFRIVSLAEGSAGDDADGCAARRHETAAAGDDNDSAAAMARRRLRWLHDHPPRRATTLGRQREASIDGHRVAAHDRRRAEVRAAGVAQRTIPSSNSESTTDIDAESGALSSHGTLALADERATGSGRLGTRRPPQLHSSLKDTATRGPRRSLHRRDDHRQPHARRANRPGDGAWLDDHDSADDADPCGDVYEEADGLLDLDDAGGFVGSAPPSVASTAPGVRSGAYGLDAVSSVRVLNNYEQGMVMVLVHVMRSLAHEYLRSYHLFYELMEDLDDIESSNCSRNQRLETLRRMVVTHWFFQ